MATSQLSSGMILQVVYDKQNAPTTYDSPVRFMW